VTDDDGGPTVALVSFLKNMRELAELELEAQRDRDQKINDIVKIQEDMDD
jgi:hypothetical protein